MKHINVRIAYLRELMKSGFIELHLCPTEYKVADILTKALGIVKYTMLREILMKGHGGVEPCFENLSDAITAVVFDLFDLDISEHENN